ncbi:hypothetical protein CJF32_00009031 [Rutstroemia sp. NJR-2017a WRK4]|nr:hypothetical protein CJF32_00009031 [Rutstroemia sp. NJR-2017a WRK4]
MLATVDFGTFLDGTLDQRNIVASKLVESLSSCGFVKLVNHGISLNMIEEAHRWENFDLGPKDDTHFPNKWTETTLPGFRDFSETKFYDVCQNLCLQIMIAFELAYKLPKNMLVERCSPPASEIRYNYYPAATVGRLRNGQTQRGWPHTDFGLITLVFQDTRGGLEYEDRDHLGTFLPLQRATEDEIAVNISDTFQRWSNDLFLAGVHQVNIPQHLALKDENEGMIVPERFSTVFFFKASRESMVGSLAPFVSDTTPACYEDISALEFQKRMTMILVRCKEKGEK